MVESHLLRSSENIITIEELDSKFFARNSAENSQVKTLKQLEDYLEALRLKHISEIVNSSDSKAAAAKKLDISPTNLQYFLSKLSKSIEKKK